MNMKRKKGLDGLGRKKSIICRTFFSKVRGLMFRSRKFKTPLLFIFEKKGKYSIHSFFCRRFLAIWYSDGKIVEKRVVEPWKISVCPARKFDRLLEVPLQSSMILACFCNYGVTHQKCSRCFAFLGCSKIVTFQEFNQSIFDTDGERKV